MKEDYQDRIENYLLNRMSDTDRLAFEQELEKDAELRDQYEFVSMVKTALMMENIDNDVSEWTKAHKKREEAAIAAQKAAYKATGSGFEYTVKPNHRTAVSRSSKRHFYYWITGIAALFIVGFFLFNNIFVGEDADIVSCPQPQGVSTIRGIDATTENLLAKADYTSALSRIESLEDEITTKLMIINRENNSRGSEQDDTEEEIEMLKYRQKELSWLKVQALLGLNRAEEAIALLNEIRNSESEFKEKADSLYYILKK